jgi:DNA-binding response OmpR family regulator
MKPFKSDLTNCRLLVVEDEYFIADEIVRTLTNHGADVVGPASTLAGARQFLAETPIDGAILDVNLQGEMIFPFADELRARGIPFVFATGYDRSIVPSRFDDIPRWEKPFYFDEFADSLSALMRK